MPTTALHVLAVPKKPIRTHEKVEFFTRNWTKALLPGQIRVCACDGDREAATAAISRAIANGNEATR
ncbi:hypothetical protein ACTXT7_005557 [Hymenolepis weldensis]